ncbi:hypothetical protein [Marinobacterium aestuariivivens]|uniref:AsmA domain-containing protein n=1 Tax=Marinobacterium aestuariivivens TaxID=1698799 RepID=A0ABW1ZVV9_9GAMM
MQQRTLSGAVAFERIEWQQPEQPLPMAALSSDFEFDGSTLENRFELRLDAPSLIAQGRARTRLAPLESDIHWQTRPLALKQVEQLWNRYHPPAPPELTVTGGQLHLDGSANWTQDGLALRLEPHIERLAAQWRAARIEGGEWKGLALMRRNGRLEHQGRLSIPLLDIGFPVETVEAVYDYRQAPQQPLSCASSSSRPGCWAVTSMSIQLA